MECRRYCSGRKGLFILKSKYVLDTAEIRLGDRVFTQKGDVRFFPEGKYYILEGRVYLVEPLVPIPFFKLTHLYPECYFQNLISDLSDIITPF